MLECKLFLIKANNCVSTKYYVLTLCGGKRYFSQVKSAQQLQW